MSGLHHSWQFVILVGLIASGFSVAGGTEEPASGRSGVDKSALDPHIRPGDDFFRYVNGLWIAKTEIPPDRPIAGSFVDLFDKSEASLRKIIEESAAKKDKVPGSEAQKIGDLYTSFMDAERIEALGLKPIADKLAMIAAIKDKPGLIKALAELEREGVNGAFGLFVNTDAKKSDQYIIYMNQGGLGLPDESYYRVASFAKIRSAYVEHIGKMFALAKLPEPKQAGERVMALETKLAKNHWDRVRNRDSTKTYNKFERKALDELTPGFDWALWFEAAGVKPIDAVVVRQPSYFSALAKAIDEVPLADWKTWLTWRTLKHYAPYLSTPFVDENFDFSGRTLSGSPENRVRWKRGVAVVESALGEALGKIYVERHFPAEAKSRMKVLVANLIEAYREDIQSLDWMSPETRKRALEKLAKFDPKIGYPDKWRDYSKLEIKRDDLIGNVDRAESFENNRQLAKLGKPVDRTEWGMTPQVVNAYYNPGKNEIVFPAAILQPPFFDLNADDAVNYGAICAVIGHEIGHGFDDQGSKYDGDGNMKDWWTETDRKEFDKRTKQLIGQYSAFEPVQLPGKHVNGDLTIGENIGDLGGLSIAYKAYQRSLGGKPAPVIDGLTGDQRFFLGWAQAWRSKVRDKDLERRLTIDPHSPAEFRCNGVVRNMPEFYKAFDIKEGDKLFLVPEKRVRIW